MMMKQWLSSPKTRAVWAMALASAIHFIGYEWARNSVMALFTSERSGFSSSSAMPLAVGCVSPFSIGLLWAYTRLLDRCGPRIALLQTTFACAGIMVVAGIILSRLDTCVEESVLCRQLSQGVLFSMLAMQSGFVYLLSLQHWSFLSSVQTSAEGARHFAPIAGLGSVSSTLAAYSASTLVSVLGLTNLLIAASIVVALSAYFGDLAYNIAQKNGFEPKREVTKEPVCKRGSLLQTSQRLFSRVPILGALCGEVLISQCVSSLLSFLFVLIVKESITNDMDRSRWAGNCYAVINGTSGLLQFIVLPFLMNHLNPGQLFPCMSVCMMFFTVLLMHSGEVTIGWAAVSFCSLKIMEYSFRGVATEMVYTALDYESRFVGKEVIGLFANRFGKSTMAIAVFLFSTSYDDSTKLVRHSVIILGAIVVAWVFVSLRLNALLAEMDKVVKRAKAA